MFSAGRIQAPSNVRRHPTSATSNGSASIATLVASDHCIPTSRDGKSFTASKTSVGTSPGWVRNLTRLLGETRVLTRSNVEPGRSGAPASRSKRRISASSFSGVMMFGMLR